MGCNVRERNTKNSSTTATANSNPPTTTTTATTNNNNNNSAASRRYRAKPAAHRSVNDPVEITKCIIESGLKSLHYQIVSESPSPSHNPNPNPKPKPNPKFEDCSWGYCTEEQLEDILMKNLEFLYNEAISKLVSLGYDEDIVLKAVLRNGHCYGGMDVLSNILHNCLAYLSSSRAGSTGDAEDAEAVFSDLRQLEEYSLAGMVCLLQQVRPHLSRGDAMWCLLMSDLHVGRASAMEIPLLHSSCNGCSPVPAKIETLSDPSVGIIPGLCKFHGGWGFGNGTSEFPGNGFFSHEPDVVLQKDIECPKRFNLTPSMKSLLKRNVAMFAAGFRANSKQMQSQACPSSLSSGDSLGIASRPDQPGEQKDESKNVKNQDAIDSVLSKFRDLNLDEHLDNVAEDEKDELLLTLLHEIKDLEKQVKDRKEWAHQKALQAARKLSSDLTELKMLRMERDETQRLKKGKQTLEDTTMKRLSEMENALRKASSQVDRANAAVRRLETENAEIRAEMEASKLSASESVTTCLEAAKREKKCLKRLLAREKQKIKLQEEIAEEKRELSKLQKQKIQIGQAQKEAEVKWRFEVKAKEQAQTQVEEERRSKEAVEATIKRQLEALRLKIDIDFQRHKDDIQRLEQELSHLKASLQFSETYNPRDPFNTMNLGNSKEVRLPDETIARLLQDLETLEDLTASEVSCDRVCLICKKDEVSVVFLPCSHQVLCATCSDNYGKKGKAACPCCRVPIEQRIRVFGASS